jgi:hypothetical protein
VRPGFDRHRFGRRVIRAAALLSVLVLVCVPAIARAGQKLETASHAPGFSRNIECPPKKVTVAPMAAVVSPALINGSEIVATVVVAPSPDTALPRSPLLSAPRPLRAPPSAFLL